MGKMIFVPAESLLRPTLSFEFSKSETARGSGQTSGLGSSFGGCRLPYWQSDCSILLDGTVRLNRPKGKPRCWQDNCRDQAIEPDKTSVPLIDAMHQGSAL